MDDLAGLLDSFMTIDDPRAVVLQEAVQRAIRSDMDLGRCLGVRGSLRAAYWRSRRDGALAQGAAMFNGAPNFAELYGVWKANGLPDTRDAVLPLFQTLLECELNDCELPGSKSQLHRVVNG